MYEEQREGINFGASASYLCSNLDVTPVEDERSGEKSYAYVVVHKSGAETVHATKDCIQRKLAATGSTADGARDHSVVTQVRASERDLTISLLSSL